ncbi:MAG: outer membrane lipoprotein-sorting protein [Flavobacteriaceae bacterium]|nr:outer membrane lipoprotein-sorting protein [Flavobacteriaceae bacterium]
MKRTIYHLPLYIFISLLLFSINEVKSQSMTAAEIIKKADEKQRGKSSKGNFTMIIERSSWSRSITMKSWSKGDDYFLILITSPAKEKGQVFLKREKEIWNWIPSIERMVKIPPSMMMQSWMGSDFTNDDLVKQSSIVDDYRAKLIGEEMIRDKMCYKIELIPNEDAPVVWEKIITWILKGSYDQWKAEYYDEDQKLVNSENSFDIKKMGDRSIPTRIEIIPENKKNQKTIFIINSIEYNNPISDSFFTQQQMKRIGLTEK